MTEKRAHRRMPRRYQVRFGESDLTHSGFTSDLSNDGMFIVTPRLVPLDSRLHIQLFLDPTRYLLFEGEVRRHKVVPRELGVVSRGGMGVRLLPPRETLSSVFTKGPPVFELHYPTREALQKAFATELRVGGVFIRTSRAVPRESSVQVGLVLDFAAARVEATCNVVHVTPGDGGGLGVIFQDADRVRSQLVPYLG